MSRVFGRVEDGCVLDRPIGDITVPIVGADDAYLECGLDENGFARVRCLDCAEEYPLGFSCEVRELCASCAAKLSAATAVLLAEEALQEVGRASVSTTLDVYSHVMTSLSDRAVESLNRQLNGGSEKDMSSVKSSNGRHADEPVSGNDSVN